ncbi:hypothetical protein K439DRAFT_228301 [Ramaria rubella]|nr:hypothetical protein K439DRAFT_228301 [Ramaria rubella]
MLSSYITRLPIRTCRGTTAVRAAVRWRRSFVSVVNSMLPMIAEMIRLGSTISLRRFHVDSFTVSKGRCKRMKLVTCWHRWLGHGQMTRRPLLASEYTFFPRSFDFPSFQFVFMSTGIALAVSYMAAMKA